MYLQGGSRQKLRNCVYICKSYAEKNRGHFPDTVYILHPAIKNNKYAPCPIKRHYSNFRRNFVTRSDIFLQFLKHLVQA